MVLPAPAPPSPCSFILLSTTARSTYLNFLPHRHSHTSMPRFGALGLHPTPTPLSTASTDPRAPAREIYGAVSAGAASRASFRRHEATPGQQAVFSRPQQGRRAAWGSRGLGGRSGQQCRSSNRTRKRYQVISTTLGASMLVWGMMIMKQQVPTIKLLKSL